MKDPEFHVPTDSTLDEFVALAELGKQARVIFHDLANHFTSLNLTIRELENNLAAEKERFAEYSKRSNETRAQIEYVANLLRCHIRGKREPFRAGMVVREVIALFSHQVARHKIRVVLTLNAHITFTEGKRDFIHIVTNLISNAVDALVQSQRMPKEIRVSLTQDSQNIFFSVSDTGCGIPDEHISKIFAGGFTTKKHGNGIGLQAAKEKVEKVFKGKISVARNKSGTCFNMILPKQNRKPSPPVLKKQIDPVLLSLERLRNHSTV